MSPPDPSLEHPDPTWRAPKIPGWLFRRIRPEDIEGDDFELAIEVVRNRRAVRRLAYAVVGLAAALGIALAIFVARVQASDARNSKGNDFSHATACLFLANVPDTPKVHDYLKTARADFPDCPGFTPPHRKPGSTATVTNTAPGKVTTRPGRPGATVRISGAGTTMRMPGPTVYRTRFRTRTRTRTVTVAPSCTVTVLGKCVSLPAPLHAQASPAVVPSP